MCHTSVNADINFYFVYSFFVLLLQAEMKSQRYEMESGIH